MNVCIVGLGAIGSHLAAHLAQLGDVQVSALARGETLKAVRDRGLTVKTPGGVLHAELHVSDDPNALPKPDYVFLTLKAHQLRNALPQIRTLSDHGAVLIPPSSGIPYWYFYRHGGRWANTHIEAIDPDGVLYRSLDPANVIGCAFWAGAEVLEPGVVRQNGAVAGYPLGELDGSLSERVQVLAAAMSRSGLRAPIRTQIRAEIWMKMINALCWNPVAVLSLARQGRIADAPAVVDLVRQMMREAESVASAFRIEMPVPVERRISTALAAADHQMSMLVDFLRRRPLELDEMVSSMDAMKERANVSTPTLDGIWGLARLRVASGDASNELAALAA